MDVPERLTNLGLSQYALKAYLSLIASKVPLNGSQISTKSGIPRARVYDILRSLKNKGFVVEIEDRLFAPLPPEELMKRLRHRFEIDLDFLSEMIEAVARPQPYNYVWTIEGYNGVMAKAKEMITNARFEVYIRIMPKEGAVLNPDMIQTEKRGVQIKYISIGPTPTSFKYQAIHHDFEEVESYFGGRPLDIIVDKEEILAGILLKGREERSPINWTKNRSFVISGRENIRHDFFHIFMNKTYDLGQPLTENEKEIYHMARKDY